MEFKEFLSKMSKINNIVSDKNYTGKKFQLLMTPKERIDFDTSLITEYREAAVLALCYPKKDKTHILLTLRADYDGTHAAQISFPGGKVTHSDNNLLQTALRETFEEVGVEQSLINQTIPLTKIYIPPSNFWVSPFIGVANSRPNFIKNYEVNTIIEVDLDDLLNDNCVAVKNRSTSYAKNLKVPCFLLTGYTVWGATAMILSEIKELLKLSMD